MNLLKAFERPALPEHVAIIMDGNGRWARERGFDRVEGHRRGAQVVRDITTYARKLGISYLTLYSFSSQNWRRPPGEVAALMNLLEEYCDKELETLIENDIRLHTIGSLKKLPRSTRQAVERTMTRTENHGAMRLTLALDYGSREEITQCMREIAQDVQSGKLDPRSIDEATVAKRLSTGDIPDPDLLIRTSGEKRLSNFLLWQIAYTEFHFAPVRWPDFGREDLDRALTEYSSRDRRYGGIGYPVPVTVDENRELKATPV